MNTYHFLSIHRLLYNNGNTSAPLKDTGDITLFYVSFSCSMFYLKNSLDIYNIYKLKLFIIIMSFKEALSFLNQLRSMRQRAIILGQCHKSSKYISTVHILHLLSYKVRYQALAYIQRYILMCSLPPLRYSRHFRCNSPSQELL